MNKELMDQLERAAQELEEAIRDLQQRNGAEELSSENPTPESKFWTANRNPEI